MANSPTIVAASLSDQDLKNSIDKLVKHVEEATSKMAGSMDSAVEQMKKKLGELGNVKIDFGGTSSGGGTKKVVNDQKELDAAVNKTTQSIKYQNLTLDQQASSMKSTVRKATDDVANSYDNLVKQIQQKAQLMDMRYAVTPLQELRMRQHELEAGMRTASENAAKAKKDVNELEAAIASYRNTMESLPKDPQGFANRQAIQKEINDLTVLRDVAVSEQKQWTSAVARLSAEYSTVNAEINKVGQSLIDEEQKEKKVTSELDRQLQKISEISSRKEATLALKSISAMESSDLDKASAKLENLKALKDKVKNTDLMSQKGMQELDSWIKYTTTLVERFTAKTSRGAKEDEDAIRKAAEAERLWADKVRQRGQVAQETSRKIIQMLNEEAQAGGKGLMGFYKVDGKDINAVRDLQNAIKDMQQQYNLMTDTEKESAIGRVLKRDIENAKTAAGAISAYNKAASGVATNTRDVGAKSVINYEILKNVIKELTQQYHNMSIAEIKAGSANVIVDKLQRTNRELQELQNRMNRPISLEAALRGSERTLDDIAYKMQRLQLYKQGIDLTKLGADQEIAKVDQKLQELQRDADKWLSKSKNMIEANNALGRSWNYMKNRLAFYFTVGASTQFVKNLIEIRSQYEMNERALGILINSAERGTQIFNELSQMALVSPYTLIELSNAAKQLTAYDIAAKDVVDTTRRLADMASAVGVPMERLTYALGQIKAYGYLNSRDARMFANAGIPLVRELSKYYSELEGKVVSVGDVYDRMKKKAIDFNSVMAVVTKMTDEGGKFFDFQAKMADTLKVRLANLTLAWNNMLNEIGGSTQGVLTSGIAALRDLFLHWKDIESALQKVIWALGLWKAAQAAGLIMIGELNTKMGAQILLGKKLGTTIASAAASTKSFISGYTMAASALLLIIADIIVTSQRNAEEIQRLNKTIADGAKEASKSLEEMLHSSEIVNAKLSASQGKLTVTDATKTWEALREQIELSALSSKELVNELILEEDLNNRVTMAFGLAERIKEATSKLGGLNDALKISQDSVLSGLFGEGIVEDIDDYNAKLQHEAELAEWAAKKNAGFWENAVTGLKGLFYSVKESLGSSSDEAKEEIQKFARDAAQVIKDELGEEGLKDKVQVNEAIARVLQGFEQMYPQIRGKGKVLFETLFNETMAAEFKGSVDRQAYYYNKFLEQLKKDHGSAFGDVTDEVLKDTHKWSSAQMDAIQKTAEKVKKDLPEASQDAIDEILRQLNSTEFKVRIVAEMATTSLDEVQKQFNDRFVNKPWIADQKEREKAEAEATQKYGTLRRKSTESNAEYEKRISEEREKQLEISQKDASIIEENKNKRDAYSKAVSDDAKKEKETADAWLKAASEVERIGGYDFSTKKENADARKNQKAAESELQKALKEELQLIDKVRSQYKKLTDAGVSRAVAMKTVTEQFGDSIKHINAVLGKNGLPKFDIKSFAGTDNPHEMMVMLKKQIDSAKNVKNIKPEEIKDLEIKYSEIKVDAEAYDATKIKKGLDNELGRLKDEYELAVSLDADPELGNMFADWMGIDVNDLPRTASEYAERASKILNNKLKDLGAKTELPNLLSITDDNMRAFEENETFSDKQLELVKKAVEAARSFQRKETEERIKDWDKLLEKYAEYEYKVTHIQKEAEREREVARKKGASQDVFDAIDNREKQELAKLDFEEFQKSSDWIVATGDLANLSKAAIGGLIDELEKYKKSAKNLNPKQIKQLNSALSKLYKEQRKDNPFKAISNMLQQAKENAEQYNEEIEKTKKEIDELYAKQDQSNLSETGSEIDKLIKKYKELKQKQEDAGEIDATQWVSSINETVSAVQAAVGVFDDLAKAIGGVKTSDINRVFDTLEKGGQGAAIGAQIGSGYGAIIGAVVGLATGIISNWSEVWSGNADITEWIEWSTRAIKRLEQSYNNLEYQIEKTAGTAEFSLRKVAIANKELQLAELERQLQLEKSRKSKYRDEDKITDLESQINDLKIEIKKASDDITNDLLGISSVGDAAEDMMGAFIEALRSGEDAMAGFNESIDEMIANMLKKLLVTKFIMPRLEKIWEDIQSEIDERTKNKAAELAQINDELGKVKGGGDVIALGVHKAGYSIFDDEEVKKYSEKWIEAYKEATGIDEWKVYEQTGKLDQEYFDWVYKEWLKQQTERKKQLEYEMATAMNEDDMKKYAEELRNLSPEMQASMDYVESLIEELGLIKDDAKQLSALQQGIQGVTETTAGAIEAYLNGVSQQVYLQSDYLRQIVEMMSMQSDISDDAKVASLSQILLQLQSSYQTQEAIRGILEGWSSPDGLAVRVEMN